MSDCLHSLSWDGNALIIVDQTQLPEILTYRRCTSSRMVAEAIRELAVRGAPAIGVAAAYACVLALREARTEYQDWPQIQQAFHDSCQAIAEARPTAVNLAWAVGQMQKSLLKLIRKPQIRNYWKEHRPLRRKTLIPAGASVKMGLPFLKEKPVCEF